jgi:hypothetical protein
MVVLHVEPSGSVPCPETHAATTGMGFAVWSGGSTYPQLSPAPQLLVLRQAPRQVLWNEPPVAAQKLLWQLLSLLQVSPVGRVPCEVAQNAE